MDPATSATTARHRTGRRGDAAPETPLYAGLWRVDRRIIQLDDGRVWTFTGWAEIGEHAFVEEGRTTAAGLSAPSARRYALVRAAGGEVDVHRHDGSLFVTLAPVPVQTVAHLCGPDLYEGRLVFPDPHRWIERWRVRGPRKDYLSLSRYARG